MGELQYKDSASWGKAEFKNRELHSSKSSKLIQSLENSWPKGIVENTGNHRGEKLERLVVPRYFSNKKSGRTNKSLIEQPGKRS